MRTVMVTGDAPATAAIVAHAVGLDGAVCPPGPIPDGVRPEHYAVFAGVLPEDKYQLVKAFQSGGHTVGMCGDGANDAPALRQAQMGIAVSTATDVAKSAAGIVLTRPGLVGIVAAVKEGRMTFQRILTYTLNSIIKKIVTVLFLAGRTDHDGAGDPDTIADGAADGHRRLPGHVADHGQRSTVAAAQCLADRQADDRRSRDGTLPADVLRRRARGRQIHGGTRQRCAENAGIHYDRVRQPVDALRCTRTRKAVGIAARPLGHRLVARRHCDCRDAGEPGRADDAARLPVVAGTLAAAIAFAFVLDLVKVPVLARLGIT